MSGRRDADWYLRHDRGGLVRQVEANLDSLTLEEHGHATLLARRARAGLAALGYDTSRYSDPPPLHRDELNCNHWPTLQQTIAYGRAKEGPEMVALERLMNQGWDVEDAINHIRSSRAVRNSDRRAAREVLHHHVGVGQVMRRDGIGRVLGVR